jgi:hypothetical protein
MAILITTRVKGQTAEGYDQVLVFLRELITKASGFIFHSAYQGEEDWMVLEVWDTKEDGDNFFSQYVAPNLPKGIIPKRSYQALHSAVTP